MLPNEEQVKSGIRWFVATFGGFIAGWFASKGWFTADQVLTVLNSDTFYGIVPSVVVFIWGLFVHKQSNAVHVVDSMTSVSGVVPKNTQEGRALAAAVSSPTVKVAGTPGAVAIASASSPPFAGGVFA